jgi:hypothetical protein
MITVVCVLFLNNAVVKEATTPSTDGETLHDQYDQIAEDVYEGRPQTPISRRARRYKLEKIEEYDLVEHDGMYLPLDTSLKSQITTQESVSILRQ